MMAIGWDVGFPVILAFLVWIKRRGDGAWSAVVFVLGTIVVWMGLIGRGDVQNSHPLAYWGALLVSAISILVVAFSVPYMRAEGAHHDWDDRLMRHYYALLYLFIASLVAMNVIPNYLFMWLALEGATLSSALLVNTMRDRDSTEAAWKYVVLTESAGFMGLIGTVLIVHFTGHRVLAWGLPADLGHLAQTGHRTELLLGIGLAVIGYGAKSGLAPFHTWLPDAHSEAPAPISATLSSLKLIGALLILDRLLGLVRHTVSPSITSNLLIGLGLLSLVIAASFVAVQGDLKRMWAYSSIEHIGLMALGFGFGGVAILGVLLHMWNHALNKSLLFFNAGTVRIFYHTSRYTKGARNLMAHTPWTGAILSIGSLSIIGLPPFAPFWSEWLIFAGGFQNPAHRWAVWVAMLLVVAIFSGIVLRLPKWLFVPGKVEPDPTGAGRWQEPLTLLWPTLMLVVVVTVAGPLLPWLLHGWWIRAMTSLTGH